MHGVSYKFKLKQRIYIRSVKYFCALARMQYLHTTRQYFAAVYNIQRTKKVKGQMVRKRGVVYRKRRSCDEESEREKELREGV